jgi:hypothetical protein
MGTGAEEKVILLIRSLQNQSNKEEEVTDRINFEEKMNGDIEETEEDLYAILQLSHNVCLSFSDSLTTSPFKPPLLFTPMYL